MITLQEFVRETIREVVQGIREAQELPDIGRQVAPSGIGGMKFPSESGVYFEARVLATALKFDVAITADTKSTGSVGGGIAIGLFSAKGEGAVTATDTTVNRVQFSVPLVFPRNDKSWNQSRDPD